MGCASLERHAEPALPEVKLSETPTPVQAAIVSAAAGAHIQAIRPGQQLADTVYRTYIAAPEGPRIVAVNAEGKIVEDARVIPFSEMPPAVQQAARTACSGVMQLCRKSTTHTPPVYLVDYLIAGDEPSYAIIEKNGFIRAVIGYLPEDPD